MSPFHSKPEPGRYTGDGVKCALCLVTRMRAEEVRAEGSLWVCADSAWCAARREGKPGPNAIPTKGSKHADEL